MSQYTAAEKYQELVREVRARLDAHDKMVARHRLRREVARRQLEIMQAIAADYSDADPQLKLFPREAQR